MKKCQTGGGGPGGVWQKTTFFPVFFSQPSLSFSFFFPCFCNRQDIIEALAEATERGVIIVTCTQCSSGAVSEDDDDIDVDDDIDDIDDDDIDDDDNDDDGIYDDDDDYKRSTFTKSYLKRHFLSGERHLRDREGPH